MSDFYTEQLIKKRTDGKDIAMKILLIAVTVISFFIAFLMPFLLLLPVVFIAADIFLFRRMDVEYEYCWRRRDPSSSSPTGQAKCTTTAAAIRPRPGATCSCSPGPGRR